MVRLATHIQLGKTLAEQGYRGGLWPRQKLVAVKAPVFSMSKLVGVDTYLGPEMKSTGEVMGVDRAFAPALYKAMLGAGINASSRRATGLIRSCGIWLFSKRVRPLPLMSPVNGS